MNRLTKRLSSGAADLIGLYEAKTPVEKSVARQTGWERLAAYEETGLEPEEIKATVSALMGRTLAEITEFEGIPLDRLRELTEADKDGRCVVLPYPIGTKVYIIIRHGVLHDKIIENVVCGYSESEWQGSINKGKDSRFVICHNPYNMPNAYELRDVFLSRAEAEAALEGRE